MLKELLIIAQMTFQLPGPTQTCCDGATTWTSNSGMSVTESSRKPKGQLVRYCGTGTAVSGNHNLTLSSGSLVLGSDEVEFDDRGFLVPMNYSGDSVSIEMPTYPSDKHFRLRNPLPKPEDIIRHCHSSWWRCENKAENECTVVVGE